MSRSPEETAALGRTFGSALRPGDVVALFGDLGSGKTEFVKGVCEGLHVSVHTGSPTFTFINEYLAPWGKVAHIDLYRISSSRELTELGIEEYFNDRTICLIEWAENGFPLLPQSRYEVRLSHGSEDCERRIAIHQVEGEPA